MTILEQIQRLQAERAALWQQWGTGYDTVEAQVAEIDRQLDALWEQRRFEKAGLSDADIAAARQFAKEVMYALSIPQGERSRRVGVPKSLIGKELEVIALRRQGLSYGKIAGRYGVGAESIRRVCIYYQEAA